MKVQAIWAFEGRNIHSHTPLMQMKVDLGSYEGCHSSDYPEFIHGLLDVLPSLQEHHCSRGHEGGFVERLKEGTYFGHVIEHVALELQAMAGMDVVYGKTRRARDGVYNVFFEYESREAGIRAGEMAVELVLRLLEHRPGPPVSQLVEELRAIALRTGLGPSTAAIARAARRRSIPCRRIGDGSLLQLGYGAKQRRVWATITDETSSVAVDIACDKTLTKRILDEAGIPVPAGDVAATENEAVRIARHLGTAVVIKPMDGNQGKGVSLDLSVEGDIRAAFRLAAHYSKKVIVEQYIPGRHYRALVVRGRVVAVAQRLPASVVGDGESSIRELVDMVNRDPARGEAHDKPLTKITIDPIVVMVLARQNMTVDHVPAKGQHVQLRDNANLSTGGTSVDVTDDVHPDVKEVCERATRLVGLDVAGVDIVIPDISQPMRSGQSAIIEVNAAPGIRMHHYPREGEARDVGSAIVDSLFAEGSTGRIPIVAITGTNGKTTVTRVVNRMLELSGYRTGMTTTDGIYVMGRRVAEGDMTGPKSAWAVLMDKSVEAAVLETARGGIIRGGLAFDYCDVACITNIGEDHLGQDGVETVEDLMDVKSLLVESVHSRGASVLNADDPHVLSLLYYATGEPILFSNRFDNVSLHKHISEGGRAVYTRQGGMFVAVRGQERFLAPVASVPITAGGRAEYNVENALAAAACGLGLGLSEAVIRQGLQNFENDPFRNPGRFNHFRLGDLNVVLDYGHNAEGFQAVFEAIRAHDPHRVVAVVGVPGDRSDESTFMAGRVAGALFDRVVIKEDEELRGRRPGEVADLLYHGARRAGMGERNISVILDEKSAVRHTLSEMLRTTASRGAADTCGRVAAANGDRPLEDYQLRRTPPGKGDEDWLVVFFEKYDAALQEVMAVAPRHQITPAIVSYVAESREARIRSERYTFSRVAQRAR